MPAAMEGNLPAPFGKATDTCGSTGVCPPRPGACTHHIAIVCGCDGAGYNNECEAWRAGTAVAHNGPC